MDEHFEEAEHGGTQESHRKTGTRDPIALANQTHTLRNVDSVELHNLF